MTTVIGLTGGIAMGKSNVSSYLKSLGLPLIDADGVTHDLQEQETKCYQKIIKNFGSKILNHSLDIDRHKLGQIVFNDPSKLKQLVLIMDPFIRQEIIDRLNNLKSYQFVVLDAPTLFENGYQYLTDYLLVVRCSPRLQMSRLRERNKLSLAAANKRIASQWPIDIKTRLADYVIDSDGSISQTRCQVLKWWNNILRD